MCDAPQGDAAEPDMGTPEAIMRGHLSGGPDPGDRSQRERDRAWARYCDDLASAWKTNPRAAAAVENRLERERGRGGASPTGGR
jgi:hypothetical protein